MPTAQIKNFGNVSENFKVIFKIGGVYEETLDILNLKPDSIVKPVFPSWVAVRGTYPVSCTTLLINDLYSDNNKKESTLVVIAHDVGVEYIIQPVDTILEGTLITPQVVVKNYGNVVEDFDVIFRIGDIYADTVSVTDLLPDSVITVSFDPWNVVRGSYVVSCSTLLAGDLYPNNNRRDSSLFVIYHDVGVGDIIEPIDTVLEGQLIMPRARLINFGNVRERFPVVFRIDVVGGGNVFIVIDTVELLAGEKLDYTFSQSWQAVRGNYIVRCSTMLSTDINNNNDWQDSSLFVVYHDVGIIEITIPPDTLTERDTIVPTVIVVNLGNVSEKFPIQFRIENVGSQTPIFNIIDTISLSPYETLKHSFSQSWEAIRGNYV
ncbi:MAG: hypothetical protein N2323_07545, partial [candidate division WOR-3 bacterium]|nr:hypothetical protein [candidate division WOR-3 bacterium]